MSTYEIDNIESLRTHLHLILDTVIQTFGIAGVGLPDRQIVIFGTPAHDCEQLTVSMHQLYLGPPGDQQQQPQRCNSVRTAVVNVELVRSVPAPNSRGVAPAADTITAFADQQAIDAWMLMESAAAYDSGRFLGGILADVQSGEPQGGFQAVLLTIIATIE